MIKINYKAPNADVIIIFFLICEMQEGRFMKKDIIFIPTNVSFLSQKSFLKDKDNI